ncbi:hypothetical protein FB451DRAFT_1177517 [Mycena latifolia]|nr:hypothetical protein FB451DRAFT_1177517 [Mycena latifolia]
MDSPGQSSPKCSVDNSFVNTIDPFADPGGNFVQCTYGANTSPCVYFTDGAFIAGSSHWPSSIAFFDFRCLAFNDPQVVANPLTASINYSDSGFLALLCSYHNTTCTLSLMGLFKETILALQPWIRPISPRPFPFSFPYAWLIKMFRANYTLNANHELACAYGSSQCLYGTTGQLTYGDGVPHPPTQLKRLETRHVPKQIAGLQSAQYLENPGANDTMACLCDAHSLCTYLVSVCLSLDDDPCTKCSLRPANSSPVQAPASGTFGADSLITSAFGATTTFSAFGADPPTISAFGAASSAFSAFGVNPTTFTAFGADPTFGAFGANPVGAVAAAAGGTASSSNSNKMSPVVIALLAMNGFLVIGGVWISRRHASPSVPHHYKEVVPTRELDEGDTYYDASVLPYRPPSRV